MPIPGRKKCRPRKDLLKTLCKNTNKPQKEKQKRKENDNLKKDENVINSYHGFNKNPLFNENTDLDYFSHDSDILMEDNSLQHD